MKFLCFAVLLSLAYVVSPFDQRPARAAGGQTGNLAGVVVSSTGPVAGATVTAVSPSATYKTTTDARGFFSILGLTVDTYDVSVEFAGFEPLSLSGVTITGDQNLDLGKVTLTKKLKTIGNVSARRPTSAFQPGQTTDSFTVSGSRLIETTGKSDTTSENAVVLAVPGVSLSNAGTPSIRGGAPTEVGYQLDGVDFAEPFLGGNGSFGRVNGLGSLQVVEGAGDATQGGVGSGVVNVIPKRGTYPSSGSLDLETGGPNFSHQLGFDYGTATRDGSVSNYLSYIGQRFVPYYGYHLTNLEAYGNALGIGYQAENQLLDNFVLRFGHDRRESLQILYSNQDLQGFGDAGGLVTNPSTPGYLSYYPTNPLSGNEFFLGAIDALYGPAAVSAYPNLIGLTATVPAGASEPITTNEQILSDEARFLKVEYDDALDARTYAALRYFNWEQTTSTSTSYSVAPGNFAAAATFGGARSGASLDFNRQIGSTLTLSFNGVYQILKPLLDGTEPQAYLAVPGFLGPPSAQPNFGDFLPGGYLSQFFGGSVPRIPAWGFGYHGAFFQEYGAGLRAQYAPTPRLKLDIGVRNEQQYQHWYNPYAGPNPNNPFDVIPSDFTDANNDPHVLQPRAAVSYQMGKNDALRFGYGRSAVFANAYTAGVPFGAAGVSAFDAIPPKPGATCGLAAFGGTFACKSYADELYWAGDSILAPDAGGSRPAIYSNYDFTFQHAFSNGYALKVTPFYKLGTSLPAASLIETLPGGTQIFAVSANAFNRTTGVEFQATTPERRAGFSGFLSATYQNVLQSAPPLTSQEDTEPQLSPATLALGDTYRAGYVSPLSIRLGGTYGMASGLSVTPVLQYDVGYPYSVGNLIAAELANGTFANVPQVNFGSGVTTLVGYQNQKGSSVSTNYYDPAFPGSSSNPNIDATRGTPATSSNGGVLSKENLEADVTIAYKRGRSTVGLSIANLFGNAYNGTIPLINPYYQPVANGLSGPLTGVNPLTPVYGAYRAGGQIPHDTYAFSNGAYLLTNGVPNNAVGNNYPVLAPLQPTTFTLYYQYRL